MWAFQACVFIARVNCTVNTSKLRLGKTPVCIFYLNIYEGSYMCVVSESNKYCILLYRSMLLINLLILFLIHHVVYRMSGKTTVALRAKTQQRFRKHNISKGKPFCWLVYNVVFSKGRFVKSCFVMWNVVFCEMWWCFVKCCVLWSTVVFCEMVCFVNYNCVLWNVVFHEVQLCFVKCVLWSTVVFSEMFLCFV